jgi:hypothetical protein
MWHKQVRAEPRITNTDNLSDEEKNRYYGPTKPIMQN